MYRMYRMYIYHFIGIFKRYTCYLNDAPHTNSTQTGTSGTVYSHPVDRVSVMHGTFNATNKNQCRNKIEKGKKKVEKILFIRLYTIYSSPYFLQFSLLPVSIHSFCRTYYKFYSFSIPFCDFITISQKQKKKRNRKEWAKRNNEFRFYILRHMQKTGYAIQVSCWRCCCVSAVHPTIYLSVLRGYNEASCIQI